MLLGQWKIFDQPDLDAYFYRETAPNLPAIPFAEKMPSSGDSSDQAQSAGVIMFADWLERNAPEIYKSIIITGPELFLPEFALEGMRFSGLGQDQASGETPQTTWGEKVFSLIENVLPQYAAYKTQRELMRINVTRAEQGLPPLESGAIAPTVNVGMSPETRNLVVIGGIGLLAVLLFGQMKRR